MKEEQEEVITGLRVDIKNEFPIELGAAICLGCILGFGIIYLIGVVLWVIK